MGRLENREKSFQIPARCLVGRSTLAYVRTVSRAVSAEHAVIYWKDEGWLIRDLSSRNGTFVNGERLSPSEPRLLKRGDTIRFADRLETYGLADDAPPAPSAVHTTTSQRCWGTASVLFVPDSDEPEASVYVSEDGWQVEVGGETARVASTDVIDLPSGRWMLELPDASATSRAQTTTQMSPFELDALEIEMSVSSDEETVEVTLVQGRLRRELGARACNYLLLTLARRRIEEADDPTVSDPGWIEVPKLAHMLRETVEKINLDVHRIRRYFAQAGVTDAAGIVQRRAGQIRIGTGNVQARPS